MYLAFVTVFEPARIFARRIWIFATIGLIFCTIALASTVWAATSAIVRVETEDEKTSAKVFIDGRVLGRTPLQLQLAPGQHELTMVWNSGATATHTVDLAAGDRRTLRLTASEPILPATLEIAVSDRGARISLDGKGVGTGRIEIKLPAGPHEVSVAFSDGSVAKRTIDVSPGARMTLSLRP